MNRPSHAHLFQCRLATFAPPLSLRAFCPSPTLMHVMLRRNEPTGMTRGVGTMRMKKEGDGRGGGEALPNVKITMRRRGRVLT